MSDPRVFRPVIRNDAGVRLFCFAPAGYGASFYREWGRRLPPSIEVCAIRLPGRENRRSEPLPASFSAVVEAAREATSPYLDRPFAIFGHSMGSFVGFEVARNIRADLEREPVHLFVSGRRAPHIRGSHPPIHALPQDEFIAEIQRRYGGIPEAVLKEPELLALTLPVLRADLAALQAYEHVAARPLDCDVTCIGGVDDREITLDGLEAWRLHTVGRFSSLRLPGGHFYLLGPSGGDLLARIAATLGGGEAR